VSEGVSTGVDVSSDVSDFGDGLPPHATTISDTHVKDPRILAS
jgi:hypothetical protein